MRVFPVTIEGKLYSVDFQTLPEFSRGWRTVLTQAHGGSATCNCRPSELDARRLSIKYVRASDHYHLARYPDTESQHLPECCFGIAYPENERINENTRSSDAVRKSEDCVYVTFHLGVSTAKSAQSNSQTSVSSPRTKRSTLKLLEFLKLVWENAGLNVWLPSFAGKRNYFTAFYRISTISKNIVINGVPLTNILLLQTTDKAESASGQNKTTTSNTIANQQKCFVIAKLARFKLDQNTPYPRNLPVTGFFGMPWIKVSPSLWDRAAVTQQSAFDSWKSGADVIVIALIDAHSSTSATAIEFALMPVTDKLLPIV